MIEQGFFGGIVQYFGRLYNELSIGSGSKRKQLPPAPTFTTSEHSEPASKRRKIQNLPSTLGVPFTTPSQGLSTNVDFAYPPSSLPSVSRGIHEYPLFTSPSFGVPTSTTRPWLGGP